MKRAAIALPCATPDYRALHQRMDAMGLVVMSYHMRQEGGFWVPKHIAGRDLALILWCEPGQSGYARAGWQPQLGPHTNGGVYSNLSSALAWVQRAREVLAGTAIDFRGV